MTKMDEILKAAKEILSTVAPTVATALGGPLGGVAVKSLIDVLGLAPDTDEKTVLEKVTNADPDMLFKFKQLEQDFSLKMKQLQVDVQSLENANLDSARNREIQTKDNTNKILAYLIVGLYIAIQLWLVSGYVLPQEMREIVMRALGTLDAIIAMVFGYYYGSSIDKFKK